MTSYENIEKVMNLIINVKERYIKIVKVIL